MLRALHDVVDKAGTNMSEASRQAVLGLVDNDSVDNGTLSPRIPGMALLSTYF